MRLLSMSDTFSATTSDTRNPAPYATLNAALYLSPGAASRKRATSSGLRTTGSLRGMWIKWVWFTMPARPSVILKKNRSVETLWLRVGTPAVSYTHLRAHETDSYLV